MPEAFYDVVICDLLTGRVSSIAGFGVHLDGVAERETAEVIAQQLDRGLSPAMGYEIVEAGTVKRGDVLPMSDRRKARLELLSKPHRIDNRHGIRYSLLQQQRMADCQCIDCGSPDLLTAHRCEPCADLHNAKSAASNRDARHSQSPI